MKLTRKEKTEIKEVVKGTIAQMMDESNFSDRVADRVGYPFKTATNYNQIREEAFNVVEDIIRKLELGK